MYKTWMSYYDRSHFSGKTGVNKTSQSKAFDICYYWYFSNKGLKLEPNVFNGCDELTVMLF